MADASTESELEDLDLAKVEKRLVLLAYHRFNGNRTQMSRALGMPIRTLFLRMQSYGIRSRERPGTASVITEAELKVELQIPAIQTPTQILRGLIVAGRRIDLDSK
jgi:hypothetical protein